MVTEKFEQRQPEDIPHRARDLPYYSDHIQDSPHFHNDPAQKNFRRSSQNEHQEQHPDTQTALLRQLQLDGPPGDQALRSSQDRLPPPPVLERQERKHPLEHVWCLFMLQHAERRTEESWKESQVEVHEFRTVEDFWCMVNHSHPPSNIGVSDYSLFKKGIKPAWEDLAVAQGGRWVAKLPTRLRTIDEVWLYVSMAMIGESFFGDYSQNICGAVVSLRPRSLKMSLWIDCRTGPSTKAIGTEFQSILLTFLAPKDRKSLELSFQSFKDAIEYRLSAGGVFSVGETQVPQTTQLQHQRSCSQEHLDTTARVQSEWSMSRNSAVVQDTLFSHYGQDDETDQDFQQLILPQASTKYSSTSEQRGHLIRDWGSHEPHSTQSATMSQNH